MKTLTEFDGFKIKNALLKRKELTDAGKTPEELPAALGEALKLEGDKLTVFLNALEVAESKTENLKRVVVSSLAEGEKAPGSSIQKDDKVFTIEFFYTAQPKRQGRDEGRHGRGGRDGKKGGKGKGRGDRGGRGGERGRGEGRPQNAAGAPAADGAPSGDQQRRRRPPRGPRPDGAKAAGPKKPLTLPKPNVVAKPAATEAQTAPETEKAETSSS